MEERRDGDRAARRAQAAGGRPGDRRLRHRLLVAHVPAPLSAGQPQDREVLRRRDRPSGRRAGAAAGDHRPRRVFGLTAIAEGIERPEQTGGCSSSAATSARGICSRRRCRRRGGCAAARRGALRQPARRRRLGRPPGARPAPERRALDPGVDRHAMSPARMATASAVALRSARAPASAAGAPAPHEDLRPAEQRRSAGSCRRRSSGPRPSGAARRLRAQRRGRRSGSPTAPRPCASERAESPEMRPVAFERGGDWQVSYFTGSGPDRTEVAQAVVDDREPAGCSRPGTTTSSRRRSPAATRAPSPRR